MAMCLPSAIGTTPGSWARLRVLTPSTPVWSARATLPALPPAPAAKDGNAHAAIPVARRRSRQPLRLRWALYRLELAAYSAGACFCKLTPAVRGVGRPHASEQPNAGPDGWKRTEERLKHAVAVAVPLLDRSLPRRAAWREALDRARRLGQLRDKYDRPVVG